MQKELSLILKKIYPLSLCEIKSLEIKKDLEEKQENSENKEKKPKKKEVEEKAPEEQFSKIRNLLKINFLK